MSILERSIFISVIILLLVFFYFLPVEKINISVCMFNKLFHAPCPFCGMLRSLHYAAKGNLIKSVHFHLFGIFIFFSLICLIPIILFSYLSNLVFNNNHLKLKRNIFFIILIIFTCYSIGRIIIY